MTAPDRLAAGLHGRDWHRCLCVLVFDTPERGRAAVRDWCPRQAPPDAPFCVDCEDRHQGGDRLTSVTVAASLARGWDL